MEEVLSSTAAACAAGWTKVSFVAAQGHGGGGSKAWPRVGSGHHPARGICTPQAGSAACSGGWPETKLLFLQLCLPGERSSNEVISVLCMFLPLIFTWAIWVESSAGLVAQQLPAGRQAGGPRAVPGHRVPPWQNTPVWGAPSFQGLCAAGWGPAQQESYEWNGTSGCASAGVSLGFPCALPVLLLCLRQLL